MPMSNKGKTKVRCGHPGCNKHGFLTVMERSCLDDVDVPWMCPKHEEARVNRENTKPR